MTFTKTSQKFGQWADSRANTVYGLGFSSEHHLSKVSMTSGNSSAGEATSVYFIPAHYILTQYSLLLLFKNNLQKYVLYQSF